MLLAHDVQLHPCATRRTGDCWSTHTVQFCHAILSRCAVVSAMCLSAFSLKYDSIWDVSSCEVHSKLSRRESGGFDETTVTAGCALVVWVWRGSRPRVGSAQVDGTRNHLVTGKIKRNSVSPLLRDRFISPTVKAERRDAHEHSGAPPSLAVRNEAPVLRPTTRREKSKAMQTIRSDSAKEGTVMELQKDMNPQSSFGPRESPFRTWVRFHHLWFGQERWDEETQPFPLTVMKVHAVGALMNAGGYRSPANYMSSAKEEHLVRGLSWSDELSLAIRNSNRKHYPRQGPGRQSWKKCGASVTLVIGSGCCHVGRKAFSCGRILFLRPGDRAITGAQEAPDNAWARVVTRKYIRFIAHKSIPGASSNTSIHHFGSLAARNVS